MENLLFALLGIACVIFVLFGRRYWYGPALQFLLAISAVAYAPIAVVDWFMRRKQVNLTKDRVTPLDEPPSADLGPWHTADKRARKLWEKGLPRKRK